MQLEMTEEQAKKFQNTYFTNVTMTLLHRRAEAQKAVEEWRESWGKFYEHGKRLTALACILTLPPEERWHYPLGAITGHPMMDDQV